MISLNCIFYIRVINSLATINIQMFFKQRTLHIFQKEQFSWDFLLFQNIHGGKVPCYILIFTRWISCFFATAHLGVLDVIPCWQLWFTTAASALLDSLKCRLLQELWFYSTRNQMSATLFVLPTVNLHINMLKTSNIYWIFMILRIKMHRWRTTK